MQKRMQIINVDMNNVMDVFAGQLMVGLRQIDQLTVKYFHPLTT